MAWHATAFFAVAMDRVHRMTAHLGKGYWRERRLRHRLEARAPKSRLYRTPRWRLRRTEDPVLSGARLALVLIALACMFLALAMLFAPALVFG